jgi:hypothetical protein
LEEIQPKATFPKTAQKAPSPPKSTAEPKPQKVQEQIPPKPTSTSEVEKQRDHEKIALPQGLGKAVTEPKVPLNHHSSLKLKFFTREIFNR